MKTQNWNTYSRHLPLLAAALVLSYIAVSEYNKLSDTKHFVSTDTTTTQTVVAMQTPDVGKVSELDLFGKNIQPVTSSPDSKIKISGIFMSSPEDKSTVALTVNGEDEVLYKVGDKIKGEGQITRITEQFVIVIVKGRPTKFFLTMEDASGQSAAMRPIARPGREPAPVALPNNIATPAIEAPSHMPYGNPNFGGQLNSKQIDANQIPNLQNNPRLQEYLRTKGQFGREM